MTAYNKHDPCTHVSYQGAKTIICTYCSHINIWLTDHRCTRTEFVCVFCWVIRLNVHTVWVEPRMATVHVYMYPPALSTYSILCMCIVRTMKVFIVPLSPRNESFVSLNDLGLSNSPDVGRLMLCTVMRLICHSLPTVSVSAGIRVSYLCVYTYILSV